MHARNCVSALRDMRAQPISTCLTAAVIGIALALPASLNLLVQNGRSLAGGWESVRDFSVYMTPGSSLEAAQEMAAELLERDGIAEVEVISAEAALAEFRVASGLGAVLDSLERNPLPHTLTVRPVDSATAAELENLAEMLGTRSDVDTVQIDTQWVQRLNAILDFMRRVVAGATVLLVIGVIVIVGNTIRLDIQSRRDEIEVVKLLGASDGFVRRPFLYIGFWYGLLGGGFALVLLVIGSWLLSGPIEQLIGLYGTNIQLLGINLTTAGTVLIGGLLAGWGGAWSAVRRHLSAIQPS